VEEFRVSTWGEDAACRGEDPEIFFPSGKTAHPTFELQRAKAICATCGVIEQCRRFAHATDQRIGVWGGLGEDERRLQRLRAARVRRAREGYVANTLRA
jgi:WhiB family redox-sensing transcriptional regulator